MRLQRIVGSPDTMNGITSSRGNGLRVWMGAAIRRAESMSQDPANAGAIAFKRSGDPNTGNFDDATILKSFGEVPKNLDEL
jgi:hypothetical protein